MTSDEIRLDTAKGIAALTFERLQAPARRHEGAFSDEFDYRGMGQY